MWAKKPKDGPEEIPPPGRLSFSLSIPYTLPTGLYLVPSGERILGRIGQALGLVVGDVAHSQELEYLEEILSDM